MFLETSKTAEALYKLEYGTPKLICYTNKRLPPTAANYLIIELELLGLCVNISQFQHLLPKVNFDRMVNHLAQTYIMKSKTKPTSPIIKRPLEVFSAYSFNLFCMERKDMTLSNFLSRINVNKYNPHEIILISFDLQK